MLNLQPCLFHPLSLAKTFLGLAPMMDALYTEPGLNAKIAVISRETSKLEAFIDTGEAAMTRHFVNGYDENGLVTLDVTSTRIETKAFGLGDAMRLPIFGEPILDGCFLKRIRVDVARASMGNTTLLDDANYEFPAITPKVQGDQHRFAYLGRCHGARLWFTGVAKYDYETKANVRFEFAEHEFAGEQMFAPSAGGTDEDNGFVLVEVYDDVAKRSALVVFDARDLAAGPVSRL